MKETLIVLLLLPTCLVLTPFVLVYVFGCDL